MDTENDFAMEFTDQVVDPESGKGISADGKATTIGNTEVNRMQLLIPGKSAGPATAVTKDVIGINGAHEFGHVLGLYHQKRGTNFSEGEGRENVPVGPNNLMRFTSKEGRQQGGVNGQQLSILRNTVNTNDIVKFNKQYRAWRKNYDKIIPNLFNKKN